MTQDSNNAPDYAGHSGAQWTWREYGYEKIVVMDERGTEIAFTHRRDWARLIAAAPDMLEALRGLLNGEVEAIALGNAAIAKAEGSQS